MGGINRAIEEHSIGRSTNQPGGDAKKGASVTRQTTYLEIHLLSFYQGIATGQMLNTVLVLASCSSVLRF